MVDEGVTIQPYWRSLYRQSNPGCTARKCTSHTFLSCTNGVGRKLNFLKLRAANTAFAAFFYLIKGRHGTVYPKTHRRHADYRGMFDIHRILFDQLFPNLEKLAKTQANNRMSDEQVITWLDNRGYSQNLFKKYGEWVGILPSLRVTADSGQTYTRCSRPDLPAADAPRFCGYLQGNMGFSTVFKEEVSTIIGKRLG